jgi:ferritin-like metal-binding protein YciE
MNNSILQTLANGHLQHTQDHILNWKGIFKFIRNRNTKSVACTAFATETGRFNYIH